MKQTQKHGYGFFFSRGKPYILKQPSNVCQSEFTRKIEVKSRDPGVKKSAGDSEFHSGNPGKLNKRRTYQSKRRAIVLGVSTCT